MLVDCDAVSNPSVGDDHVQAAHRPVGFLDAVEDGADGVEASVWEEGEA